MSRAAGPSFREPLLALPWGLAGSPACPEGRAGQTHNRGDAVGSDEK